jgi:hypothetical protein
MEPPAALIDNEFICVLIAEAEWLADDAAGLF